MRISDWSSDVCSSDLSRIASVDACDSGFPLSREHGSAMLFPAVATGERGDAACAVDRGAVALAGIELGDEGFGALLGIEVGVEQAERPLQLELTGGPLPTRARQLATTDSQSPQITPPST